MNEFPESFIRESFEFSTQIALEECANFENLITFLNKFTEKYNDEVIKLPYHINLIDELHADENAHSRIFAKLLRYKDKNEYPFLKSFLRDVCNFNVEINKPDIKKVDSCGRIDIPIFDKKYVILIENKVTDKAPDQNISKGGQLARYIETIKDFGRKAEEIYVVYTPKYEREPSEDCWIKDNYSYKSDFKDRFRSVSYRSYIYPWLKDIVLPSINKKDIYLRSAVEQYIDHLEGLFSLRTTNKKMNMELQKFIEEKLALSEQTPEEALSLLYTKENELQNAITQIKLVEAKYRVYCFESWEKQLEINFPKYDIISDTKNKIFPKVGIKFHYKDTNFIVLLEYDFKANIISYGIYTFADKKPKDPIVIAFVKSILSESYTENRHDWWYFCERTSFKNGFLRLTTLIEKIEKHLSKEIEE